MQKIVLISDDEFIEKQVMSIIHKNFPSMFDFAWYHTKEAEEKSIYFQNEEKRIYLIDADLNMWDMIEHMRKIRSVDLNSIIIVLAWPEISFPLSVQLLDFMVFHCVNKGYHLEESLVRTLGCCQQKNMINVSSGDVPIVLNPNHIKRIYEWPGEEVSIRYQTSDFSLNISLKTPSKQLKKMSQGRFYTGKETKTKRKVYLDPFKQLVVDLYLIHHKKSEDIANYFQVDKRYIHAWSKLHKYVRKANLFDRTVGKWFVNRFLKF